MGVPAVHDGLLVRDPAHRLERDSFFAARAFRSLDDLNAQLGEWIDRVAHVRLVPSDADKRTVAAALAEERPRLLPPPAHPFPCDAVQTLRSGKTPYLRFDGNDYSIPHALVRKPLMLVASGHKVRRRWAPVYLRGLLAPGDRKSVEPVLAKNSSWPSCGPGATMVRSADARHDDDRDCRSGGRRGRPKRASLASVM